MNLGFVMGFGCYLGTGNQYGQKALCSGMQLIPTTAIFTVTTMEFRWGQSTGSPLAQTLQQRAVSSCLQATTSTSQTTSASGLTLQHVLDFVDSAQRDVKLHSMLNRARHSLALPSVATGCMHSPTCHGRGRSKKTPSAAPWSSSGKPSSSMLRCFVVMTSPMPAALLHCES